MNGIDRVLGKLKEEGKKAFVAYITAGDPDLKKTAELAVSFDEAGVDILELGVPFSDPMADGIENQLSVIRSLKNHTNISGIFETVKEIRKKTDMPVVFFTYLNPVYQYGMEKFVKDAKACGVDGALILDLPPEEAVDYAAFAKKHDFKTIFLAAPTSKDDRVKLIASVSTGFIYYVSRAGVTGMQAKVQKDIGSHTKLISKYTDTPVMVGFGVSNPEQAKKTAKSGDGVIVGSAIVRKIKDNIGKKSMVKTVSSFVADLVSAVK